jgi:hypothetical protein
VTNWRDPNEGDYQLPSRPSTRKQTKENHSTPSSSSARSLSFSSLIIALIVLMVCFSLTTGLYFINRQLTQIETSIAQIREEQIKPTSTSTPTAIPTSTLFPTTAPTPNQVAIHTPTPISECPQELPSPQIELKSREKREFSTLYLLTVTNYTQFPNELFAPMPNLPSCGAGENPSRTWLQLVWDNNRSHIYCNLKSSKDLSEILFLVPNNEVAPSSIHIKLGDWFCNKTYTSNILLLP